MAGFTIDLEKLGEKDSGLTMDAAENPAEPICSDGAGPPDFTINMEKWMRGTEIWMKAGVKKDEENNEDDDSDNGPEAGNGNLNPQFEDEIGEESEFRPLNTSTPAVIGSRKISGEDDLKAAEKENRQAPLLSRLNTEMMQNQAAEEVFDQISALQAQVERLRTQDEENRLNNDILQQQCNDLQAEKDGIKIELRNTRSEALNLQKEMELSEKTLALERKSREDAGSRVGSLRAKFDPVVQELAIARSTAESEKLTSEAKISKFETKVQKLQEENAKQQSDAHRFQQAKIVEFQDLRSELDICKGEIKVYQQTLKSREEGQTIAMKALNQKVEAACASEGNVVVLKTDLDHANEQLTESQRVMNTVEDENDRLTQENDRQRKEITDLVSEIEKKNSHIDAAESKVKELKEEIEQIQAEKNAGSIEEGVREAEIDELRQQHDAKMSEVESAHAQQLKPFKTALVRAGDKMRQQEARLQKSHQEELTALKNQLQAHPATADDPTTQDLFTAVRLLSKKLTSANNDVLSLQQALTSSQTALAHQRQATECAERQWTAVWGERDRAWQKRTDALRAEREVMVKALMVAWGREEMGPAAEGQKQLYRYRYGGRGKGREKKAGEMAGEGEGEGE